MLRKIRNVTKGQSTPEYAILIALVVAAIIAMQTYAKRALQAKIRDASDFMIKESNSALGGNEQYEPYYLQSNFDVSRNQTTETHLTNAQIGGVSSSATTNIIRGGQGEQVYLNTETAN